MYRTGNKLSLKNNYFVQIPCATDLDEISILVLDGLGARQQHGAEQLKTDLGRAWVPTVAKDLGRELGLWSGRAWAPPVDL
jgi:hypothetical protein